MKIYIYIYNMHGIFFHVPVASCTKCKFHMTAHVRDNFPATLTCPLAPPCPPSTVAPTPLVKFLKS